MWKKQKIWSWLEQREGKGIPALESRKKIGIFQADVERIERTMSKNPEILVNMGVKITFSAAQMWLPMDSPGRKKIRKKSNQPQKLLREFIHENLDPPGVVFLFLFFFGDAEQSSTIAQGMKFIFIFIL